MKRRDTFPSRKEKMKVLICIFCLGFLLSVSVAEEEQQESTNVQLKERSGFFPGYGYGGYFKPPFSYFPKPYYYPHYGYNYGFNYGYGYGYPNYGYGYGYPYYGYGYGYPGYGHGYGYPGYGYGYWG